MSLRVDITEDDELFKGEDRDLAFTVYDQDASESEITAGTGAKVDITGWGLELVVRRTKNDPVARISKVTGDGITIAPDQVTNKGRAIVALIDTDTSFLPPGRYYYSMWRTDDASELVIAHGYMLLQQPSGVSGGVIPSPPPDAAGNSHIGDPSGAHAATAISVADLMGRYTATQVEGALAELKALPAVWGDSEDPVIGDFRVTVGAAGAFLVEKFIQPPGMGSPPPVWEEQWGVDGAGSTLLDIVTIDQLTVTDTLELDVTGYGQPVIGSKGAPTDFSFAKGSHEHNVPIWATGQGGWASYPIHYNGLWEDLGPVTPNGQIFFSYMFIPAWDLEDYPSRTKTGSVTFWSGDTPMAGCSHIMAGAYRYFPGGPFELMATSDDGGADVWAANTPKTIPWNTGATPMDSIYDGTCGVFVGLMIDAAQHPSLRGFTLPDPISTTQLYSQYGTSTGLTNALPDPEQEEGVPSSTNAMPYFELNPN